LPQSLKGASKRGNYKNPLVGVKKGKYVAHPPYFGTNPRSKYFCNFGVQKPLIFSK